VVERPLRILQVNHLHKEGGAAQVSWIFHQALLRRGVDAWLAVPHRESQYAGLVEIPDVSSRKPYRKLFNYLTNQAQKRNWHIGSKTLAGLFRRIGDPRHYWNYYWGREDFNFPGTWQILNLIPRFPDLIHLHNLHKDYFDLRYLQEVSWRLPTVMTLHDAWLLSGHCAHSFECERWKTGCGMCPDLTIYPEVKRDATAYNWKRKQNIYEKSLLYLACPSQWLMNKAEASILKPSLQISRVIPNGIDLSIYKPADQKLARAALDLPQDARIVLAVGNSFHNNPWKDYSTMEAAVRLAGTDNDKKLLFLVVGQESSNELKNNIETRFIPAQNDPGRIALYYQSTDIYIHAARADTFPTTVMEALACGCPVIATRVGGIPEQIVDGKTGFLVPPGDPVALSSYIKLLFDDKNLRDRLAFNAAEYAVRNFNLDKMVDAYLAYYNEILQHWSGITKTRPGSAKSHLRLPDYNYPG